MYVYIYICNVYIICIYIYIYIHPEGWVTRPRGAQRGDCFMGDEGDWFYKFPLTSTYICRVPPFHPFTLITPECDHGKRGTVGLRS